MPGLHKYRKSSINSLTQEFILTAELENVTSHAENITVTDQEEGLAPITSHPLLPVLLSVFFILSLAVLSPVLIYISKKQAKKGKADKLSNIKEDILQHVENIEVKGEIEENIEAQVDILSKSD